MPNDRTSPLKRCAIYTRKSTNHLLERDVNSLTTQREICSAYVTSQQYRGWIELPHGYDDGGHSGSRLERPALSNLMRDIEAGSVDTVVIYKIDRLTRSLLDFVRLIEIFDRRGVALVSVSQAFDTSDSMGRMILNVLLTFSQFERELFAERVRDSIRTRKRHGKPPLWSAFASTLVGKISGWQLIAMSELNLQATIRKALRDRKRCRDWLMPHMALGKPKAFTKKHYHQLALAELGPVSRAAFDDGWIWAIEDSQRPDWYNPKRRSKLLRYSRL